MAKFDSLITNPWKVFRAFALFFLGFFVIAMTIFLVVDVVFSWEQDPRFGNVPFYTGKPMLAQMKPLAFSPANSKQVRLKRDGMFGVIDTGALEKTANAMIEKHRGVIAPYGGVRDERYFLISINPDVMIVSPFIFDFKHKTEQQMRGLADGVTSAVLNPMYAQIQQQQNDAVKQGMHEGLLATVSGPNYVEVGCSFPDIPSSMVIASTLWDRPVSFDQAAWAKLKNNAGLTILHNARYRGYLHIAGCPT
jgi:hypothetical protein